MTIRYLLKRSARARTMRLVVHPDARVVVTAPLSFSPGTIERFITKHSAWLQRKVAETTGRRVIQVRRSKITSLKQRG
ncbi:MAG: YgjP-like metallopeptidase domain-containing protein, partial [Patescibacteria group bacterium]